MSESEKMAPDVAYAEAERVLSLLPGSNKAEFARWAHQPDLNEPPIRQLVLDFDTRCDDVLLSIDRLPVPLQEGVARLLDNCGCERWGEFDGDYLMLRLEIPRGGSAGKLLLLHHAVVLEALQALYPVARLTPAEYRVTMQIVAGDTPKSAALVDRVSAETKRTHLKAVLSKTGTSSQKELTNALIAHLVLHLGTSYREAVDDEDSDAWLIDYVDRYFPAGTRYHVNRGNSGHSYRCLDCGDPMGEVLIYLHQLGAVHCSLSVIEQARARGIRLLMPLRNGAVAPRDPELSVSEHVNHALDGIHYAMKIGEVKHATLMTGTSGCAYALQFVQRYPQQVRQLIVTAASYRGDASNLSLDSYVRSAYRLAVNNRMLFKSMVAYMRKSFHDQRNLKRFFEYLYRRSDSDQTILKEIFDDENAAGAFQYRIIHSAPSLLQDLHHLARPDWSPLLQSVLPVHFVHGDQDALSRIDDIEELAGRLQHASIHRVPAGGTWLLDKDTFGLFELISELLVSKPGLSESISA